MSFSTLRQNSPFYVLHKEATPYVEQGQVLSVTAPNPQVGVIGQPIVYSVDHDYREREGMPMSRFGDMNERRYR